MNKIKLPPDVEFHEDIRLLIWRPRGLLNKTAVNKIITVLDELETKLNAPFNRFADTLNAEQLISTSNTSFAFLSIGAWPMQNALR